MRHSLGLIVVIALGGLLAACSNNTAQISKMSVKGGDYEKGLHMGYVKLAKSEHSEDDWSDAGKFEDRAKLAAMGKPTAPEILSARAIPNKHQKPLAAGYERLTVAMARGGALKSGKHAAAAQTSFDCWMQEAEENFQPKDIAACRNKFYGAITLLEGAVYKRQMVAKKAPKKKAKKKARKPQTTKYVVYFDFNSAKLTKTGKTAIDFIKADVKKGAEVTLAAFTDRAGSAKYNDVLASKRAKVVYGALEKAGIKIDIGVAVFGEKKNSVVTKNGVKERLNRRVEVSVTQ